jgi:arginyl-tRNA synthetase
MKLVIDLLEERISTAMAQVAGQKVPAIVRPATDAKFGDYQVNGVMALAKKLQTDPRLIAEMIIRTLKINDICEKPQIAGTGFINLKLKPKFVAENLLGINADKNLGIDKTKKTETIVVDFSGPNIAKQMHVGHLRSTIIGDCICRLLELEGHKVIRQNHIGDWGTQFGMLIAYLEDQEFAPSPKLLVSFSKETGDITEHEDDVDAAFVEISDLEEFYRAAKERFDCDHEFQERSRRNVFLLQRRNKRQIILWEAIVQASEEHYQPIYDRLGVNLGLKDSRGESFYAEMLSEIVEELKKKGVAVESEGAICVFPKGFKDKDGKPLPVIIQKSDGAYLYATTDLAAIRYRVNELKADKIIYVTDARQQLHFQMVFKVAEMVGWAKPDMLKHVTFGSVLGEDGKPLKTREGENVKLKELLDEAAERAKAIVEEKNPDLPDSEKEKIAKAVGIGAVKYADYSNNRTSDYVFSFDKMLAMDGNTAPYMQYAYARIKSIERKSESKDVDIETELAGISELNLSEPAELDLAKHLIRYGEAIEAAIGDYRPNYLTSYLYELAQKFSVFYTDCPVLDAGPDKRPTRLLLCDLTAKTIKHGLSELLGIEVVEQM